LTQTDRQRLQAIWEERKNKVLSLESELAGLESELGAIDVKASASGVKSGALLSEYASYRRRLKKSVASAQKKLSDAKQDFMRAAERLKNTVDE
jgi:chromosome segregation ATPase